MEISGKIKKINKIQSIGSNGFQKRELVIVTNEQYPQMLLIEFIQEKCNLLNSFSIDDEVLISINLRGREWQSDSGEIKYFNAIQGWKITSKNNSNIPPPEPRSIVIEENLPF
jgi:hypothetical protein